MFLISYVIPNNVRFNFCTDDFQFVFQFKFRHLLKTAFRLENRASQPVRKSAREKEKRRPMPNSASTTTEFITLCAAPLLICSRFKQINGGFSQVSIFNLKSKKRGIQ